MISRLLLVSYLACCFGLATLAAASWFLSEGRRGTYFALFSLGAICLGIAILATCVVSPQRQRVLRALLVLGLGMVVVWYSYLPLPHGRAWFFRQKQAAFQSLADRVLDSPLHNLWIADRDWAMINGERVTLTDSALSNADPLRRPFLPLDSVLARDGIPRSWYDTVAAQLRDLHAYRITTTNYGVAISRRDAGFLFLRGRDTVVPGSSTGLPDHSQVLASYGSGWHYVRW